MNSITLPSHRLQIALFQPQIAPNTGNIGRLCVATGTCLHLVRPIGFVLNDRELKRSGMDYWDRLNLTIHDDEAAFFQAIGASRLWLLSSKAERSFWEADYADGDVLIFGNETRGLREEVRARHTDRLIRIPQAPGERCLNLSTAVGAVLYEALRQRIVTASQP